MVELIFNSSINFVKWHANFDSLILYETSDVIILDETWDMMVQCQLLSVLRYVTAIVIPRKAKAKEWQATLQKYEAYLDDSLSDLVYFQS
jgi:hypothetical protein